MNIHETFSKGTIDLSAQELKLGLEALMSTLFMPFVVLKKLYRLFTVNIGEF